MSISGIGASFPPLVTGQLQTSTATPKIGPTQENGFADRVNNAVKDLASTQAKAQDSAKAFEMGLETDLASVMVDQQVASLGFQLALNVRNKALGAYRDIMNMPV